MKNFLTAILLLMIAVIATAQEKALKVSYDYNYFSIRGYKIERPMILITDNESSKFYNPMTNWIDSLNSTPEGRAKYEATQPKIISAEDVKSIPARWEKMYIVKNRKNDSVTNYDTLGDERYYSIEALEKIG